LKNVGIKGTLTGISVYYLTLWCTKKSETKIEEKHVPKI